jgi:nitroreductase/Pyruvate/2-oxoacid:ferredoxin oxidoreductase delta subunit
MPVIHSLDHEPKQVAIEHELCDQCLACTRICPTETLVANDGAVQIRLDRPLGCLGCGHCMMVCPTGAIRVSGRDLAREDLSPLPDPQTKASVEALAALMQSRRSVRQFTDREMDEALLERILALAATAPMGIPPWDVGCVMVRGRAEVQSVGREVVREYERFLNKFQPWRLALLRPFVSRENYEHLAHFLRPLAETYLRGRQENRDLLFYHAPALLLFHHSPGADAGKAFIACTYAMLAAESLGLGSTLIEAVAPMLVRNPALGRRLGLPPGHQPAIALILGYPATHFRRTVRRHFASLYTYPEAPTDCSQQAPPRDANA